ncbi:MAG TPA: frataxin domain-containing protein [Terracidiphilus sp.]|jgi:CyaY protein
MQNEQEFLRHARAALDALKRHLIQRGEHEHAAFEVQDRAGALNILFDDHGTRFVFTPNSLLRQIRITAPAGNLDLNWDWRMEEFVLPRTGETLITLVERLIGERRAA